MKVSIIIPTYNYARYLAKAIESALNQTHCEVIVIDDGSTDNTQQIASQYPQIKYFYQKNAGVSAARNKGIQLAQGDFLLFLDADDSLLPNAIEKFKHFLYQYPHLEMICAEETIIHDDGRQKANYLPADLGQNRLKDFTDYVLGKFRFHVSGTLLKKNVFETLAFPSNLRHSEDVVFFGQLLALFNYGYMKELVVSRFAHKDSLSRCPEFDKCQNLVDIFFDANVLPAEYLSHRKTFEGHYYLDLFIPLCHSGRHIEAIKFYHHALSSSPRQALKLRYFKKYLKAVIKSAVRSSGSTLTSK